MVVVKNSSEAQKYSLHPVGDDFAFRINDVKVYEEKPEYLIFDLIPSHRNSGRCDISAFVWNDPASYLLKKFCEACDLETAGGYDSNSFIGKVVVCNIVHNKKKGTDKVYANIDPDSLVQYVGKLKEQEQEEDLPF